MVTDIDLASTFVTPVYGQLADGTNIRAIIFPIPGNIPMRTDKVFGTHNVAGLGPMVVEADTSTTDVDPVFGQLADRAVIHETSIKRDKRCLKVGLFRSQSICVHSILFAGNNQGP